MDINGLGKNYQYNNYHPAYRGNGGSFAETTQKAADNASGLPGMQKPDNSITLHWFDTKEGDKAAGCVGMPDGSSVTVYQPPGFDINNPVYKVKYWDTAGNVTERMVDISKVDPNNCDYIDMYTYSVYLNNSGKSDSAMQDFMMAGAGRGEGGCYTYEDLLEKRNWMTVFKDWMQMQYEAGNIAGYHQYRRFYDLILEERGSNGKSGAAERTDREENGRRETAETESDIVVKSDGSRVLVITTKLAGMQTQMSVEISKPTDFPNNRAGEDMNMDGPISFVEDTING